ncbi:DUF1080 domain-containing protein [Membranicola marinus]|uniref:DUF1080 domain-containing protein n=1 Tax=Membranihabitans marinus TaxID=1227546 RepID=A0A953LDP7_9BACT|nr:DUF1080 domain-containing protein [Membranihabitans marinus]MBY5959099.1 DUF1080 domain-containing protein [Membranihabitans marinus]
MRQKTFTPMAILMASLFFLFASCDSTKEPALHDNAIKLFNGKNLDGWYTWLKGIGKNKDPQNVFTVKNGMIHITGETWGCITTEEEYENYHLITEWKWGGDTYEPRLDRARDNGILLHSVGSDGDYNDTWMYSIECQIIEGGTGDFLVVGDKSEKYSITSPVADKKHGSTYVYEPDGKLVTINSGRINWWGRSPDWKDVIDFRGPLDVENPVGEWNKLECIAKGDTLTVKLNDVIVNQTFDVKPSKGRIQIQSEGAEIIFRRVDMIPL